MKTVVTLYTAAGCTLCEDTHIELLALAEEFDLVVEVIDITSSAGLFDRYEQMIPVVEIEKGPMLCGAITTDAILEGLAERIR